MSQCVPSWELENNTNQTTLSAHTSPPQQPQTLDYEVAELTWENGQLAMHGLGFPRTVVGKPSSSKYAWEKPRGGGTLESIVEKATCPPPPCNGADKLVPWLNHHRSTVAAMDALVPSSNHGSSANENSVRVPSREPVVGSSTIVGSCSGSGFEKREEEDGARKRSRVARALLEMSSRKQSVSGGGTSMTIDTCDKDVDVDFTSTSHENTSFGKPVSSYSMPTTVDNDHDSVCRSKPQRDGEGSEDEKKGRMGKSSISTKRSRAAAIHNQSERRRRDKINQRIKTLQKLVPNSCKTDKASMLDEVIEHLKQLQAQVQMMSKMSSIPHMMMPMTMQQLQMSMMAQMGMGMGMAMGAMDMNSVNRLGPAAAVPPMLHPATLFPFTASYTGSLDRLPPSGGGVLPDPFSTFIACQTAPQQQQQQQQMPMTLDAYNRMAALYRQPQQRAPPNGKI